MADPVGLDRAGLAALIDHTLLAPTTDSDMVAGLCREAAHLGVAAVCVSPSRLPVPEGVLPPGMGVAAVVGFPSGAHRADVKAAEAAAAVADGATEIDVVIDLGLARDGDWDGVQAEIAAVRAAAPAPVVLKVIIESAALASLADDAIEEACRAAERAGADMVKTSTGFHPAGGATVEAVARMRAAVGDRLGVKASGGIRDAETALAMVAAGASRLGCSATEDILAGLD
jgi:deoxyribose-phosphate aldolase